MSEANVPFDHDSSDGLDSAGRAHQNSAEPGPSPSVHDDWETLPLLGLTPGTTLLEDSGANASFQAAPSTKEFEQSSRIRDLIQTNQVLLSRVHQLEEALERSQQALQQEVERSRLMTQEEKMAVAQNHSMAQLLSELEQSNAALERQTILAETLDAQLQTIQERSKQLEQECAILRKRHSDRSQRLQTAEETCSDLRTRLQRQQRYTLQFKAALEKCLDTSAYKQALANQTGSMGLDDVAPLSSSASQSPLIMPRSEQIQPWSASQSATQTDPQLLSLIRATNDSDALEEFPLTSPATSLTDASSAPASMGEPVDATTTEADSEAEQQLWQDVERVIENSASASDANTAESRSSSTASAPETTPFTEPIPWGAPVAKATDSSPDATVVAEHSDASDNTPSDLENSSDTTNPAPAYTPSSHASTAAEVDDEHSDAPSFTVTVPAMDAMSRPQAAPSPIVHPLRPKQRKRKSLSAVELPSFPPLPKPSVPVPSNGETKGS